MICRDIFCIFRQRFSTTKTMLQFAARTKSSCRTSWLKHTNIARERSHASTSRSKNHHLLVSAVPPQHYCDEHDDEYDDVDPPCQQVLPALRRRHQTETTKATLAAAAARTISSSSLIAAKANGGLSLSRGKRGLGSDNVGHYAINGSTHFTLQHSSFHTSSKREIIPFIAAGLVIGVVGRYSYRALQRMEEERQDYLYALQEYERQKLKEDQDESASKDASSSPGASFTNRSHSSSTTTLAIDLGTAFTKMAATAPSLDIVVSPQGDRSVFNGIVYERGADGTAVAGLGRTALERYYYPNDKDHGNNSVHLPYDALSHELGTTSNNSTTLPFAKMVSDVLDPRLQDFMDRTGDQSAAIIRPIVTVPNTAVVSNGFAKVFTKAFPDGSTFVPEPVAAVWGAQFYNLLSTAAASAAAPKNDTSTESSSSSKSLPWYLVIDVGAWTTQVSMVRGNVLVPDATLTLPLGGEHVVQQLVQVLMEQQAEPISDARSLALLQQHARPAVAELATQSRVSIHVPYIFANPAQHHLETTMARSVLDQAVQSYVRDALVPNVQSQDLVLLSRHLPTPVDLQSLWMSVLTQVLEQANVLPTSVNAVLLVGGGAKTFVVHQSITSAWDALTGGGMGGNAAPPVVRPDPSIQSELTVLGAATLPPSLDYSVADGLIPRD